MFGWQLQWLNRRVGYLPIRTKLLIAFLALSGIPLALAWLASTSLATSALENLALQRLQAETETLQVSFGMLLRSVTSDMETLVAWPEVEKIAHSATSETERERLRAELLRFLTAKPLYLQLSLLNPWAEEVLRVAGAGLALAPEHERSQPFFLYRLAQAERSATVLTSVELPSETPQQVVPAISFTRGIEDGNGSLIAILVANVSATQLFGGTGDPPSTPSGTVMVVDQHGRYLYHSDYRQDWNAFLAERSFRNLADRYPLPVFEQILSGAPGGARVGESEIVSYRPILQPHLDDLFLVRSVPLATVLAHARQLRATFLVLLGLSLGLAAMIGSVAAHQFTDPLKRLAGGARRLAHGDYAHRLPLDNFDEIDDISRAFNAMAEAVEQRDKHIRAHAEQLEHEVERRTRELLQTERLAAAGELVSELAHEIGTPLNVISGYAESLLLEAGSEHGGAADLQLIVDETHRIGDLVRDLQDYARPRAQARDWVDVGEVARDSARLLRTAADKASVRLDLMIDSGPVEVFGDPLEIKQAIVNLTLNAIHASPRKAPVEIHVAPRGQQVAIRVTDLGPGIPEALRERVFQPFFTTKGPREGTGLGLAIVQRIVQRHRGEVVLTANRGRGAEFEILLPRGDADDVADRT